MPEPLVLDVGSAVMPIASESVCGDVVLIQSWNEHGALLFLADGLDHDPQATETTTRCVTTLAREAPRGLPEAFAESHRELRGARGAVAAAVRIDAEAGAMEVGIVGNVIVRQVGLRDGRIQSTTAVSVPGVLGSAFRRVPMQRFEIEAGDVIVLHSDGLPSHFETMQIRATDAHNAASEILACHARTRDDASCIVVRVLPPHTVVTRTALPCTSDAGLQMPLRSAADVPVAATAARAFARDVGLSGRDQWEVSIAASELAQNALKYGVEGVLTLRLDREHSLVLEVTDRGRGFGAAEERPGLREGLGAVRRMMDTYEVLTGPIGTRVIATKRVVCA